MQNAFQIDGAHRPGRWLITCDHASNAVPDWVGGGDLGIAAQDMARHIAWDVGAWGLAQELGRLLDSPVIGSCFSRLVIDPNRGEDDPTLVMRLSDGAVVPGNKNIDQSEIDRRIRRFYRPYDRAIKAALSASLEAGVRPIIISMHSFTPVWRGKPRPWHAGILRAKDGRLSEALIGALRSDPALVVGDNEPYNGALKGDVIDRHALAHGFSNTLIEIRQDLIADAKGVDAWADRLARVMRPILADPAQHSSTVRSGS